MATILVIDDSASVLEWMQEVLSKAGHRVLVSSNGTHGIMTLRKTPIDLVITDIYMPEQDGLEVIQHARRAASQIKVVVMSTRPLEHDLFRAATALGAVATLRKPFSQEQLLAVVATALGASAVNGKGAKPNAGPAGADLALASGGNRA